jgi:hypothetical protein
MAKVGGYLRFSDHWVLGSIRVRLEVLVVCWDGCADGGWRGPLQALSSPGSACPRLLALQYKHRRQTLEPGS